MADLSKYPLTVDDIHIRDPFILPDNGKYYLTGTNASDKTFFPVYVSEDLVHWSEAKTIYAPSEDMQDTLDYWAPEIHFYKGKYYLFATINRDGDYRGTYIFVCDTPDGEYQMLSNGVATPEHGMCLDGTLYIEDGKPYMIFCHEWLQVCNGTMCYVPLTDDLKVASGNPKLMFSATDAPWCRAISLNRGAKYPCYITDGPCMYRSSNDRLFMLWSSKGDGGYTVGIAESDNGKISGEWKQHEKPLFGANGGHCGIFEDFDGQFYLTLHQPNDPPNERMKLYRFGEDSDGMPILLDQ